MENQVNKTQISCLNLGGCVFFFLAFFAFLAFGLLLLPNHWVWGLLGITVLIALCAGWLHFAKKCN